MGKLIIVRHGHTPLNSHGKEERLRGWLDIPLDQQGLQEAMETAQQIASYPVTAIYSSDLKRACQTAEAIHKSTHAPITTTDELRPWNLGIFGGQLLSEIIPFLNLLNANPEMPAPNGESFHQFYDRYAQRLKAILAQAEKSSGYVVAVTHVRNLLAAKTILTDGDRNKVPVQGGPSTGTLTVVEKIEGKWRMHADETNSVAVIPQQNNRENSHVLAAS